VSVRRLSLLVINAALASGVAWVLLAEPPPPARAAPRSMPKASSASDNRPLDRQPIASTRSIFRAAVAAGAPVAAAPVALAQPRLRLVGVILAGQRRIGLVEEDGPGTRRVQEGDKVGGWRVSVIEPRALTLSLGSRQAKYLLDPRAERP
jgi:hypothetical protein